MMKVEHKTKEQGFYLTLHDGDFEFARPDILADHINLEIEDYFDILIEKFNGTFRSSGQNVFFRWHKDIHEAKEWFESMLVLNKLAGVENANR